MTLPPWTRLASEFRGQIAESRLLKLGLIAIIGIVWVYVLLMVDDRVGAQESNLEALDAQLSRLQPVAGDRRWLGRADDADQQLKAVQAMIWSESNIGLAEAAFQDWVRGTAAAAGLSVRQLTVARAVSGGASAAGPGGPQLVRAHLVVEVTRAGLLGFLSEIERNRPAVIVERLQLRTTAQPPVAEIDLHILSRNASAPLQ